MPLAFLISVLSWSLTLVDYSLYSWPIIMDRHRDNFHILNVHRKQIIKRKLNHCLKSRKLLYKCIEIPAIIVTNALRCNVWRNCKAMNTLHLKIADLSSDTFVIKHADEMDSLWWSRSKCVFSTLCTRVKSLLNIQPLHNSFNNELYKYYTKKQSESSMQKKSQS